MRQIEKLRKFYCPDVDRIRANKAMTGLLFTVFSLTALAGTSFGQNKSQAMPGDIINATPTTGVNVPSPFSADQDGSVVRPNHPPFDEIPPLPMPDPSDYVPIPNVFVSDSVTFHDAETGETRELAGNNPLQKNQDFGQAPEGDYPGAYNEILGEPGQQEGFGSMTLAGSLDTFPRSGNVKLVIRFRDIFNNDQYFVCSGSMQDPGVVLCAAHCVFNRDPSINGFAQEIWVYPAWDGNGNIVPGSEEVIQNFGWARGTVFLAGTDYINNGNFDRDCGLIRIDRGSSRNIGMLTGWFAWAFGGGCNTTTSYNNFSYPAEACGIAGLHNGSDMYYWQGTWDSCPGNQFQLTTGGGCFDTVWGGMSGSGAYYFSGPDRFVHAVCSNSNRFDIGRYCKLWEQFVTDLQNFENATRGTIFDLELLRCRATGSTTVQAGSAVNAPMTVYGGNATNNDPPNSTYTLNVYLSTNNNISESDTLLATWIYNNIDLGPLGGINFTIPAPTIPQTTPAGNYWIGAILASGTDTNASNNDTDTWDAQPIAVTAAAPVNDNWANTIGLGSTPFTTNGNNIGATTQANEQQLEITGATVWWYFNAPGNGTVTVDTFGSNFDTVLHIFTGFQFGFENLIPVANNDDTGGLQSQVTFAVNAGQCYEIRVGGYFGAQGNITLHGTFANNGVLIGDVNLDGIVNLLDVAPFVTRLSNGSYQAEADINQDGTVNLLDVSPFVALLSGG